MASAAKKQKSEKQTNGNNLKNVINMINGMAKNQIINKTKNGGRRETITSCGGARSGSA
jgi:hypothetical protein